MNTILESSFRYLAPQRTIFVRSTTANCDEVFIGGFLKVEIFNIAFAILQLVAEELNRKLVVTTQMEICSSPPLAISLVFSWCS